MLKITDNRFTYPFWVDAGENYYIVYFRSASGNFICLRDDILPPRVGMMFRFEELKKDIVPVKESSTGIMTNNEPVDKNTWHILLQWFQDFSTCDLKLTWNMKIPGINFENYLGKCFTIDSKLYARKHYIVVRKNDEICLSFISHLGNKDNESYLSFVEIVENLKKNVECHVSKNPNYYGVSESGIYNLEFNCYFSELDIFLKLT
jgi:hypothetical protein